MSVQIPIDLRVLGHSFRLATTEEKREDLERAAQLLNERYDEFRRKAPKYGTEQTDYCGGFRVDARGSFYE